MIIRECRCHAGVRHGLMVVGPTGGGKSSNVRTLQRALTMLKNNGEEGIKYEKVDIHHLNPKSITMGHDSASEHRDGGLASPRRRAGGAASRRRRGRARLSHASRRRRASRSEPGPDAFQRLKVGRESAQTLRATQASSTACSTPIL